MELDQFWRHWVIISWYCLEFGGKGWLKGFYDYEKIGYSDVTKIVDFPFHRGINSASPPKLKPTCVIVFQCALTPPLIEFGASCKKWKPADREFPSWIYHHCTPQDPRFCSISLFVVKTNFPFLILLLGENFKTCPKSQENTPFWLLWCMIKKRKESKI